ncbi:MAG: CBS domain-containing protein [Gammaproteobacteria bacterium]|nr:MAG: CBS domain-containing protein [Gammaproteobacteria bacterium]
MGDFNVRQDSGEELRRNFMKLLLDDVRALERMLDMDMFESGVRRIGAEQEMFLVDRASRPAPIAMEVLDAIDDPRFTYELGRFNLECNLSPLELGGKCLSKLEAEIQDCLNKACVAANSLGGDVVLVGILPTLRQSDLSLDNMVPIPRYFELNRTLMEQRGADFQFTVSGIDQLNIKHNNVMLEAVNTSFQIHFQVAPGEFALLYNLAQAVAAPVMAAAVNSPLLLGKRLWLESRIAVFEHSVDSRSEAHQARGVRPRVHFGDSWINESVLEIFREDISRFRVLLTNDYEEDPMALIDAGKPPQLNALRLQNGTVYRWNRACYGVRNGQAHLRIENRVLPSGPSVLDEVANAAFFFGLMAGLGGEIDDIREHMDFGEAKANFFGAAREGLKAQLTWIHGEHEPASDLILNTLLPQAREGLEAAGVDKGEIDHYLGVIQARVENGQTGARWMLRSLANMEEAGSMDQRLRNVTSAIVANQKTGEPVHTWPLAELDRSGDWRESYRAVGQFMVTDLFTVHPDDLVDFAASLMEWEHIRHVPVEDDQGKLVGLVSHRDLLRMVARGKGEGIPVREVMKADPFTVTPETSTTDVIRMMREHQVSCLPVIKDDRLVGLVTERDLIGVAAQLMENSLAEK